MIVAINSLEALRLRDVRDGAADEVQLGMLEHMVSRGLIFLGQKGYELSASGAASLAAYRKPTSGEENGGE